MARTWNLIATPKILETGDHNCGPRREGGVRQQSRKRPADCEAFIGCRAYNPTCRDLELAEAPSQAPPRDKLAIVDLVTKRRREASHARSNSFETLGTHGRQGLGAGSRRPPPRRCGHSRRRRRACP